MFNKINLLYFNLIEFKMFIFLFQIFSSNEGKPYWECMNQEWGRITEDMIKNVTKEFLLILQKNSTKLPEVRNYSVREILNFFEF